MRSLQSVGFVLCWTVCFGGPPEELPLRWELEFYMSDILLNLTTLICKDATLKLWQADRIQERYKNTVSYDLGVISAGIKDHFKHMLEVYKEYSNVSHIRKNRFTPEDYLDGYHIIKGDFNELRMERDLYYEVLKRHEEKKKREVSQISRIDAILKKKAMKTSASRRNVKEEEYKKSLRYSKWLEKWDQFVPGVEGVDVGDFDSKDVA